jgi:hypothetical protein
MVTAKTTITPATAGHDHGGPGSMKPAPAVTPTRPASAPLAVIETSGFLPVHPGDRHGHQGADGSRRAPSPRSRYPSPPPGEAPSQEPTLKPNQPTQRMKVPMTAKGTL